MLEYSDFYDIAEYGNKYWKGGFTQKEIACNAYVYKAEYVLSVVQGKPTFTMIELCRLICEDMDFTDYAEIQEESENALTVEQVESILQEFINEKL